jgi:hypothetical protein
MRRWARIATAGVAVLAGAIIVVVPEWFDAIGEADDGGPSGLAAGLGYAAIAAGAATFVFAAARYAAVAVLATLFVLAFSGEVADDTFYGGVAGVGLVLIGLLSLIGGRGRRGAPRASAADAASRDAPSGGPSTPDEEPGGRAPRS